MKIKNIKCDVPVRLVLKHTLYLPECEPWTQEKNIRKITHGFTNMINFITDIHHVAQRSSTTIKMKSAE